MGCAASSSYSNYNTNFTRQLYALHNYNNKLRHYNYYLHGDYDSYIYQIQAEYEQECMDPCIMSGSNAGVFSRFDDLY